MTITDILRTRYEVMRQRYVGIFPQSLRIIDASTLPPTDQFYGDDTFDSAKSTDDECVIAWFSAGVDPFERDHELGHAFAFYFARRRGYDIIPKAWQERGFTWDFDIVQREFNNRCYGLPVWQRDVGEWFADCFALSNIEVNEAPSVVLERILARGGCFSDDEIAAQPALDRGGMRMFLLSESTPSTVDGPMFYDDPVGWLLSFPLTRPFGDLSFPLYGPHTGIDLGLPADTPVYAIADGSVRVDDDDPAFDPSAPATWSGIQVSYRLADGSTVICAHLAVNTVTVGMNVRRGQVIGYSGSTGAATGPHLHFEMRDSDGTAFDPIPYLEEQMAYVTTQDFEAYKLALQKQLDENYASKTHTHTVAVSGTATVTGPVTATGTAT